ncbi:single insulin-like growth factor-binding domain protein-2 [Palaemon carinicauda]|uniref:single insulin-like growth factor-binding domain protein-2 n=1 Tax=Palaemon carinicauda TaxID=392227 RepID=UPI0035B57C57
MASSASLLLLLCISLAAVTTSGLRCIPCVVSERCPNSAKEEECPYGIVTDICDCCFVCGQGPGDKCGGVWNIKGKCGTGLECVSPQADMWGFEGICEAVEYTPTTEESFTADPDGNMVEPTEETITE